MSDDDTGWIKVSERLPKSEYEAVLVLLLLQSGQVRILIGCWQGWRKWWMVSSSPAAPGDWGRHIADGFASVIAWQPLPDYPAPSFYGDLVNNE